jgi:hypothetical protein
MVDVLDDEDDMMMIAGEEEITQIHQFFSESSLRLLRLSKRCERGEILECCHSENRFRREGIAALLLEIKRKKGPCRMLCVPFSGQREGQNGDWQ